MAKLKPKDTLGEKVARNRKINFVTTWDPMFPFPYINKAFRKFYLPLKEDEQCKNPKGSFRVSYKRGHKNLKEFLAPFKVVFENTDALRHSKRQTIANVQNVAVVGN